MSTIVCPSGFALTAASTPRTPLPPLRLSTMTCWLQRSESFAASVRAVVSVPAPGA
jgi:hypothetical protein